MASLGRGFACPWLVVFPRILLLLLFILFYFEFLFSLNLLSFTYACRNNMIFLFSVCFSLEHHLMFFWLHRISEFYDSSSTYHDNLGPSTRMHVPGGDRSRHEQQQATRKRDVSTRRTRIGPESHYDPAYRVMLLPTISVPQ